MRIFLTDEEIVDLASQQLDMINPNPDRIPELAEKLDMVYNEDLDMYEDVEEHSIRVIKRNSKA